MPAVCSQSTETELSQMTDYDETHAKELLGQIYTTEGVEIWWNSPNRNLGLHCPVDIWVTSARFVRDEINRLVDRNH